MNLTNQAAVSRMTLYKAFPWVGIYLYSLNFNNKRAEKFIYMAFFLFLLMFYLIYLGSSAFWSVLLFDKSSPKGIDENLYGFMAIIELSSILFIRTRSSLKYFPKFTMILLFTFLYYCKFSFYGFYFIGFYIIVELIIISFLLNIYYFEMPALHWNSNLPFTPSLHKPRLLFFPLFSLSSFYDLPSFWSMFYPLHDRSQFNNQELSLVDRDYVLLNSTLNIGIMNQSRLIDDNEINAFNLDRNNEMENISFNREENPLQEQLIIEGNNESAEKPNLE